jgi:putative spermidine/putrescine transport system permease protein
VNASFVASSARPLSLGAKALKRTLVALYLALIIVFLALPTLLVVVVSLDTVNYMQFPPSGFSLKWYEAIFASSTMRLAIVNSIIVAFASTLAALLFGVPAALCIARLRFPGRDTLYAFLLSPIAVPWVVFGLALLYLWSAAGIARNLTAIVIGHIAMGLPFVIRTCVAVLSGISPSYDLAARALGARRWQSFVYVTLPMMQAGIVAGAVFCILLSFINVPVPLFLTTSSSVTIQVAVFSYLLSNYDPGVSAVSTIQLLIILAALYVAQRVANLREFLQ